LDQLMEVWGTMHSLTVWISWMGTRCIRTQASWFGSAGWEPRIRTRPRGLDQLDGNHASAPGLSWVWISCGMFGGTMHSQPCLTVWISWMGTTHPYQASLFGSTGWEPNILTRRRCLDQLMDDWWNLWEEPCIRTRPRGFRSAGLVVGGTKHPRGLDQMS
jgi:hypothetical protein